jgi:hypothetical protein
MCITYVGEIWTIEPDRSGVTIIYTSGADEVRCRMSRADYRLGCESTLLVLDQFEARMRSEVVPIRAGH